MSDHQDSMIYVSSRHLGLIIGKGGSRIKELSAEFNCRINIKKDEATNDEVPIYFEGSARDVEKAKDKIQELTRRQNKRHLNDSNDNSRYDDHESNRSFGSNNKYDIKRPSRRNDSDDRNDSWNDRGSDRDQNSRSNNWNRSEDYSSRSDRDFKSNSRSNNTSRYDDQSYSSKSSNNYNSNDSWRQGNSDSWSRKENGSCNVRSKGNDDHEWGCWGKAGADDNIALDNLSFNNNEPLFSNTKYLPPSIDNWVPDDDWGIPTVIDDEKPVRKRPSNAQSKMKMSKDSHFYPVLKNFYKEHPSVAAMTVEERDKFLADKNNILIKEVASEGSTSFCNFGSSAFDKDPEEEIEEIPVPKVVPNPIRTFEEAFFKHPDILSEIRKQKFELPSPIQCIAWPVLMSGRDFIGIAQTGTGKTLAFLLPAFIHIEGQKKPREKRQGPTVLILSPTRELAIQIQNEVQKYTYHDIDSVVCYGGSDKREQIFQLKEYPEIVVGTPGRIQDLKDSGILNLKDVTYLVLDEADRMLDMGFEIQVVNLIYSVRKQRQTIMTSATWPFGVQRIALTHMKDPVQVNVGTLDLNACHSVKQYIENVDEHEKTLRLCEILAEIAPDDKIIIFVGKKLKCSDLTYDLFLKRSKGELGPKGAVRACEIHGDLDQQEREVALRMMRSGARNVMIATDVASRGLDIHDLTKVINYDFPKNIEEYVHRVGRTGRAGRTGEAITFMTRQDSKHASELIRILEDAEQEVPMFLPDLMRDHQEFRLSYGGRNRFGGRGGGRGGNRGGGFRRRDDDDRRGGGNDCESFFDSYERRGNRDSNDFGRNKFHNDDDVKSDSRYFNKPKLSDAKVDDDWW